MDCFKLIYRGSTLKDEKTLRSYDVTESSVLIVQSEFYGQYMPMGVTPQMDQQVKRTGDEAELEELAPEAKRKATLVAAEDVTHAEIGWMKARCASFGEKGMRRQTE